MANSDEIQAIIGNKRTKVVKVTRMGKNGEKFPKVPKSGQNWTKVANSGANC